MSLFCFRIVLILILAFKSTGQHRMVVLEAEGFVCFGNESRGMFITKVLIA